MTALSHALAEYDAAAIAAHKAYRLSEAHGYFRIRVEYCRSIRALALLRVGKAREAEEPALAAAKAVHSKAAKRPLFAPRILYAACLVESYLGNYADAGTFCRRGIEIATQAKRETRDLSLGYLALAESYLQAGDLPRSRESALKSVDLTARLFGPQHQDMVTALDLLTQVSIREGNVAGACARASEAAKIAARLFGEGAPGSVRPRAREAEVCEPPVPRQN